MKTAILLFSIFSSLLTTTALAATRDDAYYIVCQSMTFDSNKDLCGSQLTRYSALDAKALYVCASYTFDNGKLLCLDAIGNKCYANYETSNCQQYTFDHQKTQCLQQSGVRAHYNCP